MKESVPAS